MKDQGVLEQLRKAQAEVQQACGHLTSATPAELEKCEMVLGSAAGRLQGCLRTASASHCDGAAREAARRLRRSVFAAKQLLQAAADFHLQWRRRLETMTNGYTPAGEPVPLEGTSRLRVQG